MSAGQIRRLYSSMVRYYEDFFISYYTPRNEVRGGYTGITLSVRPSVCPSVDSRLGKMVSSA